jgi:hypothetical protein
MAWLETISTVKKPIPIRQLSTEERLACLEAERALNEAQRNATVPVGDLAGSVLLTVVVLAVVVGLAAGAVATVVLHFVFK